MELRDCFDENGNLHFNPFTLDTSVESTHQKMYNVIFINTGEVRTSIVNDLHRMITENRWHYTTDAVKLVHLGLYGGEDFPINATLGWMNYKTYNAFS